MTPEQKAAFIIAQAALLNAEIAMMQAENTYREHRGETIAYGEKEMWDVIKSYRVHLSQENLQNFFS